MRPRAGHCCRPRWSTVSSCYRRYLKPSNHSSGQLSRSGFAASPQTRQRCSPGIRESRCHNPDSRDLPDQTPRTGRGRSAHVILGVRELSPGPGTAGDASAGYRPFKPARNRASDESGAGPTDGDSPFPAADSRRRFHPCRSSFSSLGEPVADQPALLRVLPPPWKPWLEAASFSSPAWLLPSQRSRCSPEPLWIQPL